MPEATTQRTPLEIAATIALALLLAWPASIAVRNGMSDLYARPAIDYLEARRFDGYEVSEAEWRAIEDNVTRADRFMPRNPQYLEALGLLHQLRLALFTDELDIEAMVMHADAARDNFEKAAASRPTWPYYWGNLALEHHRRGNVRDDRFSLALANASLFGPWKNDTQRLVMDLGSETWEFLGPRARRELVLTVERGLHRQPENTIRIVQQHGTWPTLCHASSAETGVPLPHLQAVCRQERFAH